ncbi:MAG TPA: branched-chain amino acid ABC transporter permease/ATP-binding protein [Acidimicrobiales bacterium]|nr:branched-chain amino acid ABC transporter permease/ATP-binding protein [Acidimicrobiales bacterium]
MTEHVSFLLLGIGNGAVFAALALALVVTYRSSGVLNFATGALALHAAYTYAFLRQGQLLNPIPPFASTIGIGGSLSMLPALVLTLLIEGLVGVLLYAVVFRPLRNAVPAAKAVASLGLAAVLTAMITQQAGSNQVLVGQIFPTTIYSIGSIHVAANRLWIAVTVVAVALGFAALYRFTPFGLATRAASESEVGALVSGVSPDRVALVNWALSAMVAGLAGVLIAPLTPLVPGTYTLFIVPALAAAVLGRMSALTPAVLGGLAIGMLRAEVVHLRGTYSFMPRAGAEELVPLVLVLLVLVVSGRPLPTRGMLVQATLGRAPRPRSVWLPALGGAAAGTIGLLTLEGSIRGALIYTFISAVIALSLVVVTGYAGQISLAQLTLAGVAGFSLTGMTTSWGIPFPIAPLLAAVVATAIGVVVGLPALRIRGLLVAIVTLTLAVALEAVWFRNSDFSGGANGARVVSPKLFGIDFSVGSGVAYPRRAFGFLCLAVLVAVAVGVAKLRKSSLGSAMLAVRADERSAAATGISVVRVKLLAFGIAAFIAGIGGCLIAYQQTTVTFQSYSALGGLDLFTTTYLAGITSVAGGVVAGIIAASGLVFTLVDRAIDFGQWFSIISGIGLIVTVMKNPEGLVGPLHLLIDKRRRARAVSHTGDPEESPAASAAAGEPGGEPPVVAAAGPAPPGGLGPALLAVNEVSVTYGGVKAVDQLSFEVPEGAIVGLIGPNGAGKTTAMDALCGFAKSTGTVSLGGRRLHGLKPHQRARMGLGRTFQGIDLYDDLSVAENVVVGQFAGTRKALRVLRGHDYAQVDRVLGDLGLQDRRDDPVRDLSQGQRQLVSVARALVSRPQLLLLDEPAGGLDTRESQWLAGRLRDVRAAGTTILLIDHDMGLVLNLCDLIYVVDFGELIASGTPSEVRASARVAEAYLGAARSEEVST